MLGQVLGDVATLPTHALIHAGEIGALKGAQAHEDPPA